MKFNALARRANHGLLTAVAALVMVSCGYESPTQPSIVAVTPPPVETPAPFVPVAAPPLTMTMSSGRQDPKAGDGLSLSAHVSGTPMMPVTYTWLFGDATASSTTTDSFTGHTYARRGDYAASVTARDSAGRTAHATMTVRVENQPSPPKPPPAPPAPELSVSLTCTERSSDTPTPCNVTTSYDGPTLPSANVTNVDWDWGDGVPVPAQTTVPAATHVYTIAGTYTVFATVTAKTKDGNKTATASTTIKVPKS